MQFHQLKATHKNRNARRVGRGGKRGTYSGRGMKGQHARAGAKFRPAERELIKKIPKLRGYRFKSFEIKPRVAVNMLRIERKFKAGEMVSPETLLLHRIVRRIKGRVPAVKIIGGVDGRKKFIFRNVAFSRSAEKKTGSDGVS